MPQPAKAGLMQLKRWQQVQDTLPASLTEGRFRPFWEQAASLHRPARPFDDPAHDRASGPS